jgi:TolB protein
MENTRLTSRSQPVTVRLRSVCKAIVLSSLLFFGLPGFAGAQNTPTETQLTPTDTQTIRISQGGRSQIRLAFPNAEYDSGIKGEYLEAAREIEQTLRDDLLDMPLFNTQGPAELSVLALTGQREHDFEQYRSLGNSVILLATIRLEDGKLALDGWAWDLPSQQSILGKRYRGTLDQPRLIAHYLADALHFQFAGRPSLALTTIAFQSDRSGYQELYLMDYDGRNQRKISAHKSTSGYPDWSGKGDAIAYMSYFSGTPGIYYVDLATSRKIPVYREGTLSLSPSFSPDGTRLAFSHSRDSNVDVYVCARECTDPVRITTSNAIDTSASWSPDGRQLAFTSSRSGRPNIYVMDADGSNVRRISFEGNYNDGASWRPDGTHLAYASRAGNKFRIALTNLIDLSTKILTQGQESYEEPTFSPDGQRIAFSAKRGKASQVWVINADGSNRRQLTHEGNSSGSDWSAFIDK